MAFEPECPSLSRLGEKYCDDLPTGAISSNETPSSKLVHA